jgi:hypothetical protein
MNLFRKKSDPEMVEQLRRAQRWRRPAGLTFIILGLALLTVHVWGQAWARRKLLQLVDDLSETRHAAQGACHVSALLAYAEGFHGGFSLALGGSLGILALLSGLSLRFGGRKDRLLIQHFDGGSQLHQDQLPRDEV